MLVDNLHSIATGAANIPSPDPDNIFKGFDCTFPQTQGKVFPSHQFGLDQVHVCVFNELHCNTPWYNFHLPDIPARKYM